MPDGLCCGRMDLSEADDGNFSGKKPEAEDAIGFCARFKNVMPASVYIHDKTRKLWYTSF